MRDSISRARDRLTTNGYISIALSNIDTHRVEYQREVVIISGMVDFFNFIKFIGEERKREVFSLWRVKCWRVPLISYTGRPNPFIILMISCLSIKWRDSLRSGFNKEIIWSG